MPPRKKPTPPPERWTVEITARDLADFLAPVIPHAAGSGDLPILNGIHFTTCGGYLIASGGDSLLIWGDTIHLPEVQVPRPEVTILFDVDPPQAAATRRRVFDMVATEKTHIAGMHLHFPATAHLAREAGGYRLYPEAWEQTL